MTSKNPSPMTRHDLIDLGIRLLLGLFFAFSAGVCYSRAITQFRNLDFNNLDANLFSHALSAVAIGLFTTMVACLYALRLRAKNKFKGFWPTTAAILGSFLMSALMLLHPRTDLPLIAQIAACLLLIIGNGFAVYILTHLGRSFSILPESRALVMSGPYRIVRHPLYVAEAIAALGAMIAFLSVWSVLLVVAQFALQIVRIHFEEKTLSETFPEYKEYASRTARLIPGVY